MDRLKQNAAREKRTLKNYVERVLLDVVYEKTNKVTKAAIKEEKKKKNRNKVYSNVDEMFDDILNEE